MRPRPPRRPRRSGPGLLLVLAACGGLARNDAVELALTNRTGAPVTGAVLRFDRELAGVDRIGKAVFARPRLRIVEADTLRLEGGTLAPGATVRLVLTGRGGPPQLRAARWLVGDRWGAEITEREIGMR